MEDSDMGCLRKLSEKYSTWRTFKEKPAFNFRLFTEVKRPGLVIIHKSTCNICNTLRPKLLASKEIENLSSSFVVISLMDDNEPKEEKWGFDGKYYPRVFFLDTSGQIMKEVKSPEENAQYKYYYTKEESLIQSMTRVLQSYPDPNKKN